MNLKDGLELNYWKQADLETHAAKIPLYLWAWGCFRLPKGILEIGCGPLGGFLPMFPRAKLRVGVDPLMNQYRDDIGYGPVVAPEDGVHYVDARFEDIPLYLGPFDTIFCADALDHGEMGFHLFPKIHSLLEPGGRLYLHVNLRPPERLNESHDHALTLAGFMEAVKQCEWVTLNVRVWAQDIDGLFDCPTLMAVLEKR